MKRIGASFKAFYKRSSKRAKSAAVMVMALFCMAIPAFAEGTAPTYDLSTTLQSSLTTCATNIMTALGVVLPIALGIVAAMFGVKYGIKFFKSISKG